MRVMMKNLIQLYKRAFTCKWYAYIYVYLECKQLKQGSMIYLN